MAEYIEREAIKYEMWAVGPFNTLMMCVRKKTIDAIPAADVVERKRGEWKKDTTVQVMAPGGQKYHFRCSECGYTTRLHDQNFCPNCGARMDDEQNVK